MIFYCVELGRCIKYTETFELYKVAYLYTKTHTNLKSESTKKNTLGLYVSKTVPVNSHEITSTMSLYVVVLSSALKSIHTHASDVKPTTSPLPPGCFHDSTTTNLQQYHKKKELGVIFILYTLFVTQ